MNARARRSWLPALFGAALALAAAPALMGGSVRSGPSMSTPRAAHTATLLADGRVLLAGGCTRPSCEMDGHSAGAELFDPEAGRFSRTGAMTLPRVSHTATRLRDGRVLIAGGWTTGRVVGSAELYDPRTGRFTAGGSMRERRSGHAATLLKDGRVLLSGGTVREGTALKSAEVYDPARGTFTPVAAPRRARSAHVAVLLRNGKVLIAGGHADRSGAHADLELFDPVTGGFTPVGNMTTPRNKLAGALLPSGRVLLLGGTRGYDRDVVLSSAEVYDPVTGLSRATAPMGTERYKFTDAVTPLPDGRIFVTGGGRAELFDEGNGSFVAVPGTSHGAEQFMTATTVRGGVLIAGGYDSRINPTGGTWLYSGGTPR